MPTVESELVAPGVHRVADTCNSYLVEAGDGTAIAIDFGAGRILEVADELRLTITDVLMTHHHRDQGQGLPLAVERGIRIHVPAVEVDLFARVEERWQARQLDNDYDLRQDRFSLLQSVPVASTVSLYRERDYGGVTVRAIPTPGHTMGSVTYLVRVTDAVVAFTGDLIYAPGKVWSLAASQWSYSHHEGPAMTVISALLVRDERADILAPSHGAVMLDPAAALTELVEAMQDYVNSRRPHPWDLTARLRNPWLPISAHLLLNTTSLSCSYALLSETGEALLIDFGYDMTTGLPAYSTQRDARLTWLPSVPALRQQFGVTAITVGLPTHYHDDHVAGFPLLREVMGTELWIPSLVAGPLADPFAEDLPCQWFEPILADRLLETGEPFRWNEYTITPHAQPGHTKYAVAYEVQVDGSTVVFTGDQQEGGGVVGERREFLNYQYRNRFERGDFVKSAELYRRIAPGLMLTGHWEPRSVDAGYLDLLAEDGAFTDAIHDRLLPTGELSLPVDSVLARIAPYRSVVSPGAAFHVSVEVESPSSTSEAATVRLVVPDGWDAPPEQTFTLAARGRGVVEFVLRAPDAAVPKARIAVDVTIGALRLGQHADAVVDVVVGPAASGVKTSPQG